MRNGIFLKIRVSEIRVKRIRVNQGLGVFKKKDIKRKLTHFCPTENSSSRIKTRSQFSSISKDSKGNFLIKVSLRYEESIQYLVIGEVEKENRD